MSRAASEKKTTRRKKTEHQVPVVEPVIPPTQETDPWRVPVGPLEDTPGEPEIPQSIASELLDEAAPFVPDVPHRRRAMWVGVAICMTVILGGWFWSFRYALRIPASVDSDSALAEAYDEFRATFGSISQSAPEIVAPSAAAEPPSAPEEPPADPVIEELKKQVMESAASETAHQ